MMFPWHLAPMASVSLLIVAGFLATGAGGAAAFAPIQWAKIPGKRLTLVPKNFPEHHLTRFTVPQELTIAETTDTMVPYFTAKSDNTISVAGWCVEAAGEKRGDAVLVNSCDGGPAQQWNWIPDAHGRNMIQLKNSNLCFDVADKKGSLNGASVELHECESRSSESWFYEAPMSVPAGGGLLTSDARHVTITLIVLAGVGSLSLSAWFFGRSTTLAVAGGVSSNCGQESIVSSSALLDFHEGRSARSSSARRGVICKSMDDATFDDLVGGGATADGANEANRTAVKRATDTVMLENPFEKLNPFRKKEENPLANLNPFRKKEENALSRGIDDLFKDAPLPVKFAASLVKPLVGALGTALESAAADNDALLLEAERALRMDPQVEDLLGKNVTLGAVFSSSSSSSNINGQVTKMINLQCQCAGASGSGIAAIRGETDSGGVLKVVSLQCQAGGRVVNVSTLRGGGYGNGASGSGMGDDGVIDVEVL